MILTTTSSIPAPSPIPSSFRFYPEERLICRPRERITVSQWAERYRIVTEGERKGPWTNRYAAYLAEPMDCWNDPNIRKVILCFAPQTGKTQVALNCLGYSIDQAPGPAMYVMPTEGKAKDFGRGKLDDLLRLSPRLAALLSPYRDDTTTLQIYFRNAMKLMVVWANSPSALSSESIQYLFFDETDKYEVFSGREADPVSLGEKRTTAYPHTKKMMYFSTPVTEDGVITRAMELEADEIRDYYARCPACGYYQRMIFDQIKWPKHLRDPRTVTGHPDVYYECINCFSKWNDWQRDHAVSQGEWRPRSEDARPADGSQATAVAFHLPAWYSRNYKLSEVAARFLEGLHDLAKKQDFINAYRAEPWNQIVKTRTQTDLLKARVDTLPPQTVPDEAVALTMGVDVQKYGFWFVVRAWARDYTSWLIHYGRLASWDDVEAILYERTYPRATNPDSRLSIWRCGVDTGGSDTGQGVSMTEAAYWWLVKNVPRARSFGQEIYGTKGASLTGNKRIPGMIKRGEELLKTPSGKKLPTWLHLMIIDTSAMKDTYHYHIDQAGAAEPRGAYLHAETGKDYINQILAEEKHKDRRGIEEWVRIRQDNHYLDCEVIAMSLANYNWPGGGVNLIGSEASVRRPAPSSPAAPTPPHQAVKESITAFDRPSWLNR